MWAPVSPGRRAASSGDHWLQRHETPPALPRPHATAQAEAEGGGEGVQGEGSGQLAAGLPRAPSNPQVNKEATGLFVFHLEKEDQVSKRFLQISAALLCLACAYHLGARRGNSAPPGAQITNPAVALDSPINDASVQFAMTAIGDVYQTSNGGVTWRFVGNLHGNPSPTGP